MGQRDTKQRDRKGRRLTALAGVVPARARNGEDRGARGIIGNGAAMRVAPAGSAGLRRPRSRLLARRADRADHPRTPLGIGGAVLQALAVAILAGLSPDAPRTHLGIVRAGSHRARSSWRPTRRAPAARAGSMMCLFGERISRLRPSERLCGNRGPLRWRQGRTTTAAFALVDGGGGDAVRHRGAMPGLPIGSLSPSCPDHAPPWGARRRALPTGGHVKAPRWRRLLSWRRRRT